MKLRPEAIAILQVFKDKSCKEDDFIPFNEFGEVMVFGAPEDKVEGIRLGLQELIEGEYVNEYKAGLGITATGLNALS
jgi:hypothetical protein